MRRLWKCSTCEQLRISLAAAEARISWLQDFIDKSQAVIREDRREQMDLIARAARIPATAPGEVKVPSPTQLSGNQRPWHQVRDRAVELERQRKKEYWDQRIAEEEAKIRGDMQGGSPTTETNAGSVPDSSLSGGVGPAAESDDNIH